MRVCTCVCAALSSKIDGSAVTLKGVCFSADATFARSRREPVKAFCPKKISKEIYYALLSATVSQIGGSGSSKSALQSLDVVNESCSCQSTCQRERPFGR